MCVCIHIYIYICVVLRFLFILPFFDLPMALGWAWTGCCSAPRSSREWLGGAPQTGNYSGHILGNMIGDFWGDNDFGVIKPIQVCRYPNQPCRDDWRAVNFGWKPHVLGQPFWVNPKERLAFILTTASFCLANWSFWATKFWHKNWAARNQASRWWTRAEQIVEHHQEEWDAPML